MVDPIGTKAVTTSDRRVAPVQTSVASTPGPLAPVAATTTTATSAATTSIARSLAAEPPVDYERVSRIRAAIARGTYPILPETIADRLIAIKLDWNPHDPS